MVYIIYIYDYHYNMENLNIDFLYDIDCYLLNSCYKCDKSFMLTVNLMQPSSII